MSEADSRVNRRLMRIVVYAAGLFPRGSSVLGVYHLITSATDAYGRTRIRGESRDATVAAIFGALMEQSDAGAAPDTRRLSRALRTSDLIYQFLDRTVGKHVVPAYVQTRAFAQIAATARCFHADAFGLAGWPAHYHAAGD